MTRVVGSALTAAVRRDTLLIRVGRPALLDVLGDLKKLQAPSGCVVRASAAALVVVALTGERRLPPSFEKRVVVTTINTAVVSSLGESAFVQSTTRSGHQERRVLLDSLERILNMHRYSLNNEYEVSGIRTPGGVLGIAEVHGSSVIVNRRVYVEFSGTLLRILSGGRPFAFDLNGEVAQVTVDHVASTIPLGGAAVLRRAGSLTITLRDATTVEFYFRRLDKLDEAHLLLRSALRLR